MSAEGRETTRLPVRDLFRRPERTPSHASRATQDFVNLMFTRVYRKSKASSRRKPRIEGLVLVKVAFNQGRRSAYAELHNASLPLHFP